MPEPSLDQLAEIQERPNQHSPEGRRVRTDIQVELGNMLGDNGSVLREPGLRSDGRTTHGNILIYGVGRMARSRTAKGAEFGIQFTNIHDGTVGQDHTVETMYGIYPGGVKMRKTTRYNHEFDPQGVRIADESLFDDDPSPKELGELLRLLRDSKPFPELPPPQGV